MGSPCSCSRQSDRIQIITNDAVVVKASSTLTVVQDSGAMLETATRQLSVYLQENQAYMNKKLAQLFQYSIDHPADALTSIQLKLCQMKDGDWTHFSMLVTYGKAATRFMIWKTTVNKQGFEFLCSYLGILTRLTVLTVEDVGLSRFRYSQFADGLKRLSKLSVLNLGNNSLTHENLQQMENVFPSLSSLLQCNFDENQLDDKSCEVFLKAIDALPKLNLLSLRFNLITGNGAVHLLAAVEKRKGLRILADGNQVESQVLERLKQVEDAV